MDIASVTLSALGIMVTIYVGYHVRRIKKQVGNGIVKPVGCLGTKKIAK